MPGTRLKGLDSLRAIAALMVFVDHIESFKGMEGRPALLTGPHGEFLGSLGVTIFFVLSGFLITWLLLEEREATGRVHVKAFFVRRILRIWPLYFLMVFFAFWVAPHLRWMHIPGYGSWERWLPNLLFYLGMMPNVAIVLYPWIPNALVLWSVGVEEQFYAVWPFLWRGKLPAPRVLALIALTVVGARLSCVVLMYKGPAATHDFFFGAAVWLYCSRVSCMAIGALGAYLYRRGEAAWMLRRRAQWLALLSFAVMAAIQWMLCNSWVEQVIQEALSVALAVLIVNMACNPRPLIGLDNRWLGAMGKISYGFYVLHSVCIAVFLSWVGAGSYWLYPLSLGSSLLVAALSYRYFERPFLRWKRAYEWV